MTLKSRLRDLRSAYVQLSCEQARESTHILFYIPADDKEMRTIDKSMILICESYFYMLKGKYSTFMFLDLKKLIHKCLSFTVYILINREITVIQF